jgi:translation initiation factor IF-2
VGGQQNGSLFRKIDIGAEPRKETQGGQQQWAAEQLRKGSNEPTRQALRGAMRNNQNGDNQAKQRGNIFGQSSKQPVPSNQPAKVAMPSFLKATSSAPKQEAKPVGWGTGFSERKPLEYGEHDPVPEFVREPEPPIKQSNEPVSQPNPPPAFGMGADADLEPYKPKRSETESVHDILNVDPRSVLPPSTTAYRPDFQREAQQPTQPPPTRARIVDRDEYRFNPNQDSPQGQDNWQNLRRRQSEPAPPPSTERPTASTNVQDDSWIDRRFAEHQQERASRTIFTPPRASRVTERPNRPLFDPFAEEDTSKRRCGRCGEIGHVARQCSLPSKHVKCHSCGLEGHSAKDCPSSVQTRSRKNWDGPQSYQRGDQRSTNERNDQDDIVDPRQEMMSRMQSRAAAQEPNEEDEDPVERARKARQRKFAAQESAGADEESTEPVLRSRKFRDDEPKKDKPARRGRRDDDEDYGRDERRSRRGRDFEEDEEDGRRNARKVGKKEAKEAEKKAARAAERVAQQAEQKNQIKLPEFISVQNLAQALGVRYEQFVDRLEDLGYDDIFPGKIFNTEVSGMIAMEYEMEPVFDSSIKEEEERDLKPRPEVDEQDKDLLPTRPPVVTIMGHVDHGKTTILDYLRKSSVAAGEAGGITQHIGAFSVPLAASGKTITFLDTPGHAAFLAMRQRGANVTDIVILVVAADDSVKPQTLEAIKHAKSAGVPMLVAINKCDKESADVQRVKQDLARHGVEIEDFGGDTQVVEVSGKTGLGMDELEEAAVTLSEILDHRADTEGAVEGWVLEATTKKAGRVATVLVRRGTLKQGAFIVAGKTWARVRSLHNEAGVAINEAGPGMPVEVDGWREQPSAGDEVIQAPTEQKATSVVEYRLEKVEREKTAEDMEAINEARRLQAEKRQQEKTAAQQAKNSEDGTAAAVETAPAEPTSTTTGRIEVPFIIKADVSGSAEAVEAYIMSVSSPMVAPRILYSSVGAMHESDIELAGATQGHIIAFNLPANEGLKAQALTKGVKVLENNIIYRVLDDVKAVLEEYLPPIVSQRVLGEAEVGAAFEIGVGGRKKVKIAGCKIRNGVIANNTRVRVMRGEEKVYDGTIASLKNVKKDVQEMRKGSECGMGFDGWEGFEVGDQIQTYEERSEKRTL